MIYRGHLHSDVINFLYFPFGFFDKYGSERFYKVLRSFKCIFSILTYSEVKFGFDERWLSPSVRQCVG